MEAGASEPSAAAAVAAEAGDAAGGTPEPPKYELPPLNYTAAHLAKEALGMDPRRGFNTMGRFLCCPLCANPDCEPSCPLFGQSLQQQALYEYIVLHEPVVDMWGAADGAREGLTKEQAQQQLEAARVLAMSSRTAEQKARDLADCRQLFELAEVRQGRTALRLWRESA